MTDITNDQIDHRLSPPFGVVAEPDTHHGRLLTPRSLALAAACLLFRQDGWGCISAPESGREVGRLSVLGSLCVAAGGTYDENGDPEPPQEAAAAEVLTCTCKLLAAELDSESPEAADPASTPISVERRLDQMRPVSSAEKADVQHLLATVHGVALPV